ncbi:MAG: nuclear transport factor 2 family protein [Cyanobacteria bacterium P01_C01_bin.120]
MVLTQVQVAQLDASPVIERYFESFNAGKFEVTAALFAPDGLLHAPFEEPIVGNAAIVRYLQSEAAGMEAYPKSLEQAEQADGANRFIVRGRVKAIVFKVNVAWIFDLNEAEQIQKLRVKLLASMEDLLKLRSE